MAAAQPRIVLVPRRPGSLHERQPGSPRQPDELDDLIDGIFGPPTDERPGRFDAGLVGLGLGLTAWAAIADGPSLMLLVGIASIVLGLALPARMLIGRFDACVAGLRRRMVERGTALDASHPATLALVDAHARLLQASGMRSARNPERTVAVGHAAVREVTRILEGKPPDTPTKTRLVWMRTAALEALTDQLLWPEDRRPARAASRSSARAPATPSPSRNIPVQSAWLPPRTHGPPPPRCRPNRPGRSQ